MNIGEALPRPEVYYDSETSGKCYFVRNSRNHFIAVTEGSLKRMLKEEGISDAVPKGEVMSQMERVLNEVQRGADVEYAGPLAGYQTGQMIVEGRRVLVTHGPTFLAPEADGDWPVLRLLLENLLGPEQMLYFFGWLKVAVCALRAGRRRPGQCLVMAGPGGCGKSLLQNLITRLLGGRSAKPYQYMTGGTQFNSELFQAEHLMIEDEASEFDYRLRRKLGANLKAFVVNETQRCHPKNRKALTLLPFWRISLTCNDEAENLMVMPPLDESVQDKIMLLRAFKHDMPMPTESLEEWASFMRTLDSELPRFLYFLLHRHEIPRELKCQRYGITHFHHPELLRMMNTLSAEVKLLELIDTEIFAEDRSGPMLPTGFPGWHGKASKLEAELCGASSKVAHEARKLMIYNSACGQYLGRLQKLHPERISSRVLHGTTLWTISPIKLDEKDRL